jgi:hypothetical protein
MKIISKITFVLIAVLILTGCIDAQTSPSRTMSPTEGTSSAISPSVTWTATGFSEDEYATLNSLVKVDDHPLYSMRYYGDYDPPQIAYDLPDFDQGWACSLFATLVDHGNLLYGRNFDWQHSPAVLLFTDPQDGYASVSMVDIAYLGFEGDQGQNLTDIPLAEREALLIAPRLPFDGMNEHGLVVGMAAVPPGNMQPESGRATISSLGIIRQILDRAINVEEALTIIDKYNIDMGGGPPIHYLIADRSGAAALVEFYNGRMFITYNDAPWHQATNFLRAAVDGQPAGQCWRYDRITQSLASSAGRLTASEAMELLDEVSQVSTQWSVVYDFGSGDIQVVMGRKYDQVHRFRLSP